MTLPGTSTIHCVYVLARIHQAWHCESRGQGKKGKKKVNEVLQKRSGSDRPVPVWCEFYDEGQPNAAAAAMAVAEHKEPGGCSMLS